MPPKRGKPRARRWPSHPPEIADRTSAEIADRTSDDIADRTSDEIADRTSADVITCARHPGRGQLSERGNASN